MNVSRWRSCPIKLGLKVYRPNELIINPEYHEPNFVMMVRIHRVSKMTAAKNNRLFMRFDLGEIEANL